MKNKLLALAAAALLAAPAWTQAADKAADKAIDTLEKIKAGGEISLGVRTSAGLGFALGDGKYAGFHTEMAERIVEDLGKQAGKALKINSQAITSQNRVALLQGGVIDFECGSTTHNRARQKDTDFAVTTYVDEVRMAVKADSSIAGVADLNGKTVATTAGSSSVQHLRRHEREGGYSFKEVMGRDHAESFRLLESGRADAFVMDAATLSRNIAASANPAGYKIVGEALSIEPIACTLRKGDDKLRAAIDASIKRQIADGSLHKLYDKWFMQPIPPHNTALNQPLPDRVKAAWEHPGSKPQEEHGRK